MILIITAQFNSTITAELQSSAEAVLKEKNEKYEVVEVPGCVEIPITAQKCIRSKKPDVVIALGCVIKGDTDHYEWVVKSCQEGLDRVALDESTPIIHGILVCRDPKHALARQKNGTEYAETALIMKKMLHESA